MRLFKPTPSEILIEEVGKYLKEGISMNKIRVINLLNRIANGNEVPNKIKYNGKVYFYHKGYDFDYAYTTDEGSYLNENKSLFQFSSYKDNCWNDNSMIEFLNKEVEIIEEPQEHKIPDKIDQWDKKWHYIYYKKEQLNQIRDNIEQLRQKYNEIIDYLEERK